MNKNRKILLYSMPAEAHRTLAGICLKYDIECKKIPKARFSQTIACHVGLRETDGKRQSWEGGDFPAPMLVFSGIDDKTMDFILDEYKKSGLPSETFKAIVTPHNLGWSAVELYAELNRERREIAST